MDFNGLVIATDHFSVDEAFENWDSPESKIDLGLDIAIVDNLATSTVEMLYHKSEDLSKPLATLKTSVKFWIDINKMDKASAERILYAVKTQHSYMYFILYQKLSELKLKHVYLQSPSDNAFYNLITKSIIIADLAFNEQGNYLFPF